LHIHIIITTIYKPVKLEQKLSFWVS